VEWAKTWWLSRSTRSDKQRMHQSLPLLNLNLLALTPLLHPHLSILDGWVAMEGDGPTRGDPVDWRIAVASTDFLASDALTSELMGFPISTVGYLHYCRLAGLGASKRDEMDILGGVATEAVQRSFLPSPTYRLQSRWRIRDEHRLVEQALALNHERTDRAPGTQHPSESRPADEAAYGDIATLPLSPAGEAGTLAPALKEKTA
jgi:hypothetical protein